MPKRTIPIKYTSRDFDSIKDSLVEYVKRYYPDTYRDFNEASFGSLMLDTVSYIGDVLSFYLDYQVNECFLDTAVEYDNVVRLGRQLGYKFRGNPSSYGLATFFILIPSTSDGTAADTEYMPILKKGSSISSFSAQTYMLDEDVHFNHPNNEVRVARVNAQGLPTHYAVRAFGTVTSGVIAEEYITVNNYKKFLRVSLGNANITEILSVTDDEGHEYYEVDYLSQDSIYKIVTNRNSDNTEAPAILKPFSVPRRFVREREENVTYLQFGASSDVEFDIGNKINPSAVDPSNVVINRHGMPHISDPSLDPYQLVTSDEFGVAPSNTSLRVLMRVNTSDNVNASVGSLSTVSTPVIEFLNPASLTPSVKTEVENSIEVSNNTPIVGDVSLPNSQELKRRILDSFGTQQRAVTAKDYESMTYAMPSELGAIKRCRVLQDQDSMKRNLNMYVISEDGNQYLTKSNATLKQNLKTWLSKSKMVNDTVDILDAKILNLGIIFEAVGRTDMSKLEILQEAKAALRRHFVRYPEIGETFFITDVYKVLKDIDGIVDVTNVEVVIKSGGKYSDTRFNVRDFISPDGRYISIPKNCIYEVKYLKQDIVGVIK